MASSKSKIVNVRGRPHWRAAREFAEGSARRTARAEEALASARRTARAEEALAPPLRNPVFRDVPGLGLTKVGDLAGYCVRTGSNGEWGIFMRAYNVRLATFSPNSGHLRRALTRLLNGGYDDTQDHVRGEHPGRRQSKKLPAS